MAERVYVRGRSRFVSGDLCRYKHLGECFLSAHPRHHITVQALAKLRAHGEILCIAPQNLVEYWGVATRPTEKNGLGMATTVAKNEVAVVLDLFALLPYTPQVLDSWLGIVIAQRVVGKQVHDAHLVAMMHVHSIAAILTFNGSDFLRFPGIAVLDPASV